MRKILSILFLLCFRSQATIAEREPIYRDILSKSDVILWAQVERIEMRSTENPRAVLVFELSDVDFLKGKSGTRLVVHDTDRTDKTFWAGKIASITKGTYTLLFVRKRSDGEYEFPLGPKYTGIIFFPEIKSSPRFASFDELLAYLYFSNDSSISLGAWTVTGDVSAQPWHFVGFFDAARRLSRASLRESPAATKFVERTDQRLFEPDYVQAITQRAAGSDLIRFQLLRFQAAWNRRWGIITSLYSPEKKSESLDSLPAVWEKDGELIGMDIKEVVVRESTAEVKGNFTYTKAGTRAGSFTLTRAEEGWIITSRPR